MFSNVFWKYQKLAHHPYEECEKNIDQAIALPDEFFTEIDLKFHGEVSWGQSC